MTDTTTGHEDRFWEVAEPLLERDGVSRSTMMGLPCVRIGGQFFGSFDRRTGDLLVKLPSARVEQLIADGQAHPFAPAGRRFREWAAVPPDRPRSWEPLLAEALAFVASRPAATPKRS